MQSTSDTFRHWHLPETFNKQRNNLGEDHIEFLKILGETTWITLDGHDQSRQRAIVTLLHGNEPSGLKAIHDYLCSGEKPATNLGIFVVSVNAALLHPIFSHRYLPEEHDFNRCFNLKDNDSNMQERLARKICETLEAYKPEAIIDTHNTSAHSEAFAVATADTTPIKQIAQNFTRKLVVLDQKLGTLIEHPFDCPVVTIEFGGFLDPRADLLARDTIGNYISRKQLFDVEAIGIQILNKPLRLEIKHSTKLHYSASVQDEADITIFNTIDQMNFSLVSTHTNFGWLGSEGLDPLMVLDRDGENFCHELFTEHEGFIVNRVAMTIFMATTDAYIASNDCLMYICPEFE